MSKLLEKIFKEKLQDYDAGMSPDAWKTFEKRLDAGKGSNSALKYVLWSVGIAAVLTPVLYFSIATSDSQNELLVEGNLELKLIQPEPSLSDENKETGLLVDSNDIAADETQQPEQKIEAANAEKPSRPIAQNQLLNKEDEEGTLVSPSNHRASVSENTNPDLKPKNDNPNIPAVEVKKDMEKVFVSGRVTSDFICQGETIKVMNSSDKDNELVRVDINGLVVDLKSGKDITLQLEQSTEVLFLNKKNEVIGSRQIEVIQVDIPVANIETNIYHEGLPVAEAKLIGTIKSAEWYYDNRLVGHGAEQRIFTFNRGRHSIDVKGLDVNGCAFELEIPVHVEDDYNLMAPNSFAPEGVDIRRRTFIPFALTQRDTPFTLTIIDPRDNDVIYTTRDANAPWDGIDRRTGKLVSKDRSFVWKVQLENPKPGEKNVYIGNVIHF
jgi:hypothetical protein